MPYSYFSIVDVATANAAVSKWLRDVANRRVHAETGHAPHTLYKNVEKKLLQPIPRHVPKFEVVWPDRRPVSLEVHSLQHPLSGYQQILTEVAR